MDRAVVALIWTLILAGSSVLLAHLIVNVDVGATGLTSAPAVLTCALLVAIPALIFLPIASRLAAPFFDAEAITGWGTLGFVIIFFAPDDRLTYGQFLALLLPLTVSVASVATLVAYPFVARLRPTSQTSAIVFQARRIGYLAAVALVALVLLNTLELLTPFNGSLVIAVAVLAELFSLEGGRSSRPAA